MIKIIAYKQKIKNLLNKNDQSISKVIEGINSFESDFKEKKSQIINEFQLKINEIKNNCLGNSDIIVEADSYANQLEGLEKFDFFNEFNTKSVDLNKQLITLEEERKKLYENEKKPIKNAKDFISLKQAIAALIKKEMSTEAKIDVLKSIFSDLN